jgi:CRISPR-associated protein Cas5d
MDHFPKKRYCLEVKGDFACFTRPEMKVERVSYDVITPSAGRAIYEAIFWKPAIRWSIRQIDVLEPIQWTSVRRNEVKTGMKNNEGIFIEDSRTQRAGLILRDVAYLLHADMIFIPFEERKPHTNRQTNSSVDSDDSDHKDEKPSKYYDIFERRVKKGQCFNQPYFGCREFSLSSFKLLEQNNWPDAINQNQDFGFMLFDVNFKDENNPAPAFYRAMMKEGKIVVPDWDSPEVFQ